MTHAGYFEGIGGFSLGAKWAGINTVYTCELDEYRHSWLKAINPNATHERDITTSMGQAADIFTGGFPCQDISCANPKGLGLRGARSGLWFDYFEQIKRHRPSYAVVENSPNLLHKGLESILRCFASIGYYAEWRNISKRSLGFPDLRKRLIIIAYPDQVGRQSSSRVFDRVAYKMCQQKVIQKKQLWLEALRMDNPQAFGQTVALYNEADTGLSRGLVKAEIEAYGDAICPYVAMLIFELILQHHR